MTYSTPPIPSDPVEIRRIEHTRMRRRILYGEHEALVQDRLVRAIGTTRSAAVRIVDMTANPAYYVCSQLAALYRELPDVLAPAGGEDTEAAILESGYWQLMQRVQRDTIAFNDYLVRVDLGPDGEPAFRLVPPDLVKVVASPMAPGQPLAVREWIKHPDKPDQWVRLVTDPRTRTYAAFTPEGVDITREVLGADSFSGDAYPYVVDGRPVLPYVAYHAAQTGSALDPFTGQEIWEGALQLGVYYSMFGHVLRQASWAQRYTVGLRPSGADVDESGRRREAIADPTTVIDFQPEDEGGATGQVGQWSAPVDPERYIAAIERYERRLVESALSTVGVSRRDSDVRSAMSLAVSREAQREAQRAYLPVFQRSDLHLLRLVAGLRGEPTQGWRIHYRALPRDAAELAAEVDRMERLIAMGLLDRVSAYQQLHPGLSVEEARAAIQTITETNARLSAPGQTGQAGAAPVPIALTSTDIASIVTVNEARASQGLSPIDPPDGALTVSEYQAKHAAIVAAAANAVAGDPAPMT